MAEQIGSHDDRDESDEQRFSLRQLLMFVTVVSILMGLLVAIHQIRSS